MLKYTMDKSLSFKLRHITDLIIILFCSLSCYTFIQVNNI